MLERARATNQTLQMVMTSIKGGLLVTSQSDDMYGDDSQQSASILSMTNTKRNKFTLAPIRNLNSRQTDL